MTRPRILVAEDHEEVRRTIIRLLKRDCDILDAVADGKELLEAVDRFQPDLCVLDISMPNMSGIEAATRLRQIGSPTKIVFLTLHSDPDFLGAALNTGADGYVIKAKMDGDLLLAIREAMSGRRFISALDATDRSVSPD